MSATHFTVSLTPDSAKLFDCLQLAHEMADDAPWNDVAQQLRELIEDVCRSAGIDSTTDPGSGPIT